jgi:hypothetical protein
MGFVLTGIVAGMIGFVLGMIVQQEEDKVNIKTAELQRRLANAANGKLSRRICHLKYAVKGLRERVDKLTPQDVKDARKNLYIAAKTIRPNLPK